MMNVSYMELYIITPVQDILKKCNFCNLLF